ncbi:MAG: hypothetical protein C5S48_03510 [Candidatus Methanogaster sp.]|nr:MAG: hypothetical protein C5S48_03510 [ANME-2 cluster archaeon]
MIRGVFNLRALIITYKTIKPNKGWTYTIKIEKALVIGTTLGLALTLFSIFVLVDSDWMCWGAITAILVGILVGRLADASPVRYTIHSIFTYNLLVWTIIALFDPDARIVLEFGNKAVVGLFIGFILSLIGIYSIIGAFSAFVTRKMSHCRLDHGGCTR